MKEYRIVKTVNGNGVIKFHAELLTFRFLGITRWSPVCNYGLPVYLEIYNEVFESEVITDVVYYISKWNKVELSRVIVHKEIIDVQTIQK